jgi:hypothetical protein
MTAKKSEDDLVDAGSEYSFPASDPPSYMGGTLVMGAPARDGSPPREPVNHELIAPTETKSSKDSAGGTDAGGRQGSDPAGQQSVRFALPSLNPSIVRKARPCP